MAGVTGLEPAASGVTGRRSNQLSYTPAKDHALRPGGDHVIQPFPCVKRATPQLPNHFPECETTWLSALPVIGRSPLFYLVADGEKEPINRWRHNIR